MGDVQTQESYGEERREFWNRIAVRQRSRATGSYYRERLCEIYGFLVPPGLRVLELGCAHGDLLASLAPMAGVGIDFSREMIRLARSRHPELRFVQADTHDLELGERFDVVILSDLVNDLWDVQRVLGRIRLHTHSGTRVILNFFSNLWSIPRQVGERLKIAVPLLPQNWLGIEDLENLLRLAGFEVIRSWREILWPVRTPLLDRLFNRYLVKLWPLDRMALTNLMVARPAPAPEELTDVSVSVVVPARNERGNIESIFTRTPRMGRATEIIFVEGGSNDGTYEEIERAMGEHPEWDARLFRQSGSCKADAVRLGFEKAAGELFMILDADLTVGPEDLLRFYDAWRSGKGEYINGVRLVYPMENEAMRFLNLVANRFFSVAFSWLLGQPIKDTLCGTKVLSRRHYNLLAAARRYFGEFDPFGDFDLIFGAAKLNLMMVDLPIRYRARVYGETNISRWRHGFMLLRMLLFAMRRLKFV